MGITPVSIILIVAGFIGLLINTFEIVHLLRSKQSTTFNKTVASLCISDLLSCLTFIGFGVTTIIKHQWGILSTDIAMNILVTVSVFHLLFIGIQRLIAIALPLKVNQIFTARRCITILSLIWIAGTVYGILVVLIFTSDRNLINSAAAFVSGMVLFALYIGIGWKIRQRNRTIPRTTQSRQSLQNRLVFLHSVCVTIAFALSYLPFPLEKLFAPQRPITQYIFHSLMTLNPIIDALVYFSLQYYRHKQLKNITRMVVQRHYEMKSTAKRIENRV